MHRAGDESRVFGGRYAVACALKEAGGVSTFAGEVERALGLDGGPANGGCS